MNPVARRLSAILAADVVGFSGLMEADETATLAALGNLRDRVLQPRISERRGRVVKVMGDGSIVEFASVVDAVAAAVAIQMDLGAEPIFAAARKPIVLRIGVHLGDVVVDDDLMGDGVNIAARLEQLCSPGGLLVSGEVHDQLDGKLDLELDYAGARQLKNIRRPIRVYALRRAGVARLPRDSRPERRLILAIAAGLCLLIVSGGLLAWQGVLPPYFSLFAAPASGTPTLAVLPFENAGDEPGDDFFAEGITDEILIALARSPLLNVVGRNSSAAYGDPKAERRVVAEQLGARYLVTGRVQKSADRVRVTARLTDMRSRAEGFDGPPVKDGMIAVPDRPGLGLSFIPAAAKRHLDGDSQDFFD